MRAVLGLGCNLGDRAACLHTAGEALKALSGTTLITCSSVYVTAPIDVPDAQDDYYNQVVLIETELSPHALLGACLGIEAAMGRVRILRHSSRIIDIDLLLYEGFACADAELTVPHPAMLERAFVLVPLHEIFQNGTALGLNYEADYSAVKGQNVRQIK